MTPAEQLAKEKQRSRPKRNKAAASEVVLWDCRLCEHRERLNLSMRDVAHRAGLSTAAYFRIEKGYADVRLSHAVELAAFFGVKIEKLWTAFTPKDAT